MVNMTCVSLFHLFSSHFSDLGFQVRVLCLGRSSWTDQGSECQELGVGLSGVGVGLGSFVAVGGMGVGGMGVGGMGVGGMGVLVGGGIGVFDRRGFGVGVGGGSGVGVLVGGTMMTAIVGVIVVVGIKVGMVDGVAVVSSHHEVGLGEASIVGGGGAVLATQNSPISGSSSEFSRTSWHVESVRTSSPHE